MENKNITLEETNHLFFWIVNHLAKSYQYKSWKGEQLRKEIDDTFDEAIKFLKNKIVWDNLTIEECKILGFGNWTCQEDVDDDKKYVKESYEKGEITKEQYENKCAQLDLTVKIKLIPLYLYKAIPEGLELISIFGEKVKFGENFVDDDTRCGCLAYGIIPKEK